MISLWETRPHYGRHLYPIAAALREMGEEVGYYQVEDPPRDLDGVLVVAAYAAFRTQRRRFKRFVLVEHGIGQSYSNGHWGHPGGGRNPYDLHISPGPHLRDRAAQATADVGCLPLDYCHPPGPPPSPCVAVSFHWRSPVEVESGTALGHFRDGLSTLNDLGVPIIGHGHPLWGRALAEMWEQLGWEYVESIDEVYERASVYVIDNSSTMLEFASLDRPVVLLNHPEWRRDVDHGRRFWAWADIGEQVDDPETLAPAVARALEGDEQYRSRRREVVAECYGSCDGRAARRAALAIRNLSEGRR